MSGPLAVAFELLAAKTNFTYTLHRVLDDVWGINTTNGWTGMLGMLERNEADLAIGPFTLTYPRWSAFMVSIPIYIDTIEILVPALEWNLSLFNMLTVFTNDVWLLLFLSLVVMCFLISAIERGQDSNSLFSVLFHNNLWNLFRTLLQKGRLIRPKCPREPVDPKIMLHIFWMFFTLVIAQFFSGVLLTNLLVRRPRRIDSIDDLSSSDFKAILEPHSSVFSAFESSESEVYRSLFKKVMENPKQCIQNFKSMSTLGMDLVMSGSFSIVTEGMALRHFLAERYQNGLPCNFRLAAQPLWPIWKGLVFRRNFPRTLIHNMNIVLREIAESGWLQKRMINEFEGYSECLSRGDVELQSLQLKHVIGTFILWALGCSTAVLACATEVFLNTR